MGVPRPTVDIRSPPPGLDDLTEWLDRWSTGLVLLEAYPLEDVRRALAAVAVSVRAHRQESDPWARAIVPRDGAVEAEVRIVLSDHEWFETSIAQFWWFFGVVEKEDHGGHRQALGQFGRVLAEALRRHRADERELEAAASGRAPSSSPTSRQP